MGNYRANSLGDFQGLGGLPFPPSFLGAQGERGGAGQEAFQRYLEQSSGVNSFGQMFGTHNQTYRGIPTEYVTGYVQFLSGCQHLVEEIRRGNKNNCITQKLKGETNET